MYMYTLILKAWRTLFQCNKQGYTCNVYHSYEIYSVSYKDNEKNDFAIHFSFQLSDTRKYVVVF